MVAHSHAITVCVVWDYSNSKQKVKQDKQKTATQNYKAQIKILAYPGLA